MKNINKHFENRARKQYNNNNTMMFVCLQGSLWNVFMKHNIIIIFFKVHFTPAQVNVIKIVIQCLKDKAFIVLFVYVL